MTVQFVTRVDVGDVKFDDRTLEGLLHIGQGYRAKE